MAGKGLVLAVCRVRKSFDFELAVIYHFSEKFYIDSKATEQELENSTRIAEAAILNKNLDEEPIFFLSHSSTPFYLFPMKYIAH